MFHIKFQDPALCDVSVNLVSQVCTVTMLVLLMEKIKSMKIGQPSTHITFVKISYKSILWFKSYSRET